MHFFLCIRLEAFYVKELVQKTPALAEETLVVLEEGRVLDVSDDARLRGVVPGMPKSQAKALIRGGRFIDREKDDFVRASRAWLDRLIPFTDAIEPIDQHEAVIDLSRHPRPEDLASLALAAVAESNPRTVSGAGCSKWLARLAVDRREAEGGVSAPREFLYGLPVDALVPVSAKAIAKLQALGYSTIGQVQEVPLDVLRRQFGSEGQVIHQAAHGKHFEPVRSLYPEATLSGYFPFEGGIDSLEVLESGCEELAKQLGGRISAMELETSEMFLHVEHERAVVSLSRNFSKPIRDERTFASAARLLLSKPPTELVYGIRASLPRLKQGKQVQANLFAMRSDQALKLERAVSRVQNVFGAATICFASEVEVPRRIRVLQEMGSLVGWR